MPPNMVRSCVLAAATLLLALPALAHGQTTTASGSNPASSAEPAGATGTTTQASVGGDVPIGVSDAPVATVAQEPEPDPESGEEQPGEPSGEPQPPTGDEPVGAPGGGLPRTGLEALKLALLGFVLFLVGARVRVVMKRRQAGPAALAADGLPDEAPAVSGLVAGEPEEEDVTEVRDGWSFPDPDEPSPTGLLPSTAMARRQARERERLT
jgi:hypothetical protein